MTICQYFIQGRCRFGQNCRFEHSNTNDDRNTRIFLNSQQLNAVVKKVAEAVISSEKGGQWPLSCFSPLKGANIPGWEDYSPEELRWKMYEARTNGTLNETTLKINQLYSNAEKMRNLLKEPTMERINIIANLIKGKTEPSGVSNPFTSLSSSSNIFGGSVQSSGPKNIFGGSSGPGSQGNIFGVTATNTGSQGNIFGGSSQSSTNIFGGAGSFSNQNIFGNSISSSNFSNNPLSNSTNVTPGGNANIFESTSVSNQNIFSKTDEGNNQSISNAFSQSQNCSGIFLNYSSSSTIVTKKAGNENQNQSFSFSSSQNENIFNLPNSFAKSEIFSPLSQSRKNAFGNQQITKEFDLSVYSKLEDLNEEEIRSFTSATFAFGKIPLKPPPQKYCK